MLIQKPTLIIVFGLPGTGKTTFASQLAHDLEIAHLNTDMIRERLGKSGQYDLETKKLIYDEMLKLTEEELKQGNNVIVDGTFYKSSLRDSYESLAKNYDAEVKRIEMRAEEEVVLERLTEERRYSEADQMVYQIIMGEFDPVEKPALILHTDREDMEEMIAKALTYLQK